MTFVLAAPRSPPLDVPNDIVEDEEVPTSPLKSWQGGNTELALDLGSGLNDKVSSKNILLDQADDALSQVTQLRSPLSELMWAVSLVPRNALEREAITNRRRQRLMSQATASQSDSAKTTKSSEESNLSISKTNSPLSLAERVCQDSKTSSPTRTAVLTSCAAHAACSPHSSRRRPARTHRMEIRRRKTKDLVEASPVKRKSGQADDQPSMLTPTQTYGGPDTPSRHSKPQTLFVQRRRAATSPARATGIEQSSSGLFIPHVHHSPRQRGMARSNTQAAIVASYGSVEGGTRLQRRRPASLHLDVEAPDPSTLVRQLASGKSSSTASEKRTPHDLKSSSRSTQHEAAFSSPAMLVSASMHMSSPETAASSSMQTMSAPRRAKTAPFSAAPLVPTNASPASTLRSSGKKKTRTCDERCPHRLKGSLLSAGATRLSSASPYSCSCLFPTPLTAPRTWSEDLLSAVLGYDFDERNDEGSLCKLY